MCSSDLPESGPVRIRISQNAEGGLDVTIVAAEPFLRKLRSDPPLTGISRRAVNLTLDEAVEPIEDRVKGVKS